MKFSPFERVLSTFNDTNGAWGCPLHTDSHTSSGLSITFFFLRYFSMHTIFKVSSEFVTILLLFYVLVLWPWGIVRHSSPIRDQIQSPCSGRRSLNHWTHTRQLREVPKLSIIFAKMINKKQWHLISGVRVISLGKRNQPGPHKFRCHFQGGGQNSTLTVYQSFSFRYLPSWRI